MKILCLLRQLRGQCPYEKICQVEATLAEIKKELKNIQEKSNALKTKTDGHVSFEDGCLKATLLLSQKETLRWQCPYRVDSCLDIILIQTGRFRALKRQMIAAVDDYNLTQQLLAIFYKQENLEQSKEAYTKIFATTKSMCLFYVLGADWSIKKPQTLQVGLWQTTSLYETPVSEKASLSYEPDSNRMIDTCFQSSASYYSFQLIFDETVSLTARVRIIQQTEAWLTHQYAIGKLLYLKKSLLYWNCEEETEEKRQILLKTARTLHFKSMGKMSPSGVFQPEQLLFKWLTGGIH